MKRVLMYIVSLKKQTSFKYIVTSLETTCSQNLLIGDTRQKIVYLVKKFLPYFPQWSIKISSTLICRAAMIDIHASTAHNPSFSLIWSLPVPKLSSPQRESREASMRFPKNFQPVGTSKNSNPSASATLEIYKNRWTTLSGGCFRLLHPLLTLRTSEFCS